MRQLGDITGRSVTTSSQPQPISMPAPQSQSLSNSTVLSQKRSTQERSGSQRNVRNSVTSEYDADL